MTRGGRANAIRWGALAIGVLLFVAALYYIHLSLTLDTVRRLGVALPLALLLSGLWHLVRTWAWAWCFPQPRQVSFLRLARVRLAAEAFSYLTLRGIAGEPLKVVLLDDRVDAREATAAVALERLAYMIGTTLIVGIGSVIALFALPLTPVWFRVFRAFAIAAAVVALFTGIVIAGRGTYVHALFTNWDRRFGTAVAGWPGGALHRVRRAADAGAGPESAVSPRRPHDRDRSVVRAHVARGVGDPEGERHADLCRRRAHGRNVLARGQLRIRLHPGQPRGTRGVEPCGRGGSRDLRRRGPRARAQDPRTLLGGRRAGDLSPRFAPSTDGRRRNTDGDADRGRSCPSLRDA